MSEFNANAMEYCEFKVKKSESRMNEELNAIDSEAMLSRQRKTIAKALTRFRADL